jgi:hypothetical protein
MSNISTVTSKAATIPSKTCAIVTNILNVKSQAPILFDGEKYTMKYFRSQVRLWDKGVALAWEKKKPPEGALYF